MDSEDRDRAKVLKEEWDCGKNSIIFPGITIDDLSPKTSKKPFWLCNKGHSYQASMRHRTEGSQCPICANRKLLTGYNDFASRNPDLIKAWKSIPENPDPITYRASTPYIKFINSSIIAMT